MAYKSNKCLEMDERTSEVRTKTRSENVMATPIQLFGGRFKYPIKPTSCSHVSNENK